MKELKLHQKKFLMSKSKLVFQSEIILWIVIHFYWWSIGGSSSEVNCKIVTWNEEGRFLGLICVEVVVGWDLIQWTLQTLRSSDEKALRNCNLSSNTSDVRVLQTFVFSIYRRTVLSQIIEPDLIKYQRKERRIRLTGSKTFVHRIK